MKQNKYDESSFFTNYSQMARSIGGLDAAGEWSFFRQMLPELAGTKVLDLGCGFGWHCRYVREQNARSVVGIDLSGNMLERAKEMTDDEQIEYRQLAIEDIDFPSEEFDIVISSLALHYVEQLGGLFKKIHHCLTSGGAFVFSVEHPVFTALGGQDWHYGAEGEKLHWPLDDYHREGLRQSRFLEHDVVKYHRTVSTYMNLLLESGFELKQLSELQPTKELLNSHPAWQEEMRRPMFLIVSAVKK
ncbi:methyltransferase domain-containing protein [Paenibacillus algorifonticola]|uniref:class I SAM-dependent methyltransferase n=1 Tax=Paenibacillus algorifonticola TaxID=684063 RepID=UPI003D2DA19A